MPTVAEALAIASDHHQAGRLPEAEQIYRQVLVVEPGCASAWHSLGGIAFARGERELAAECVGKALALMPQVADGHFDLALILQEMGQLDAAAASYREAIALKPGYAAAQNNLGNVLKEQNNLDEAAACYCRALEIQPGFPEAQCNLGTIRRLQNWLAEAVGCYQRALALKPDFGEAWFGLGTVWMAQGRSEEAIIGYRRTLELRPHHVGAHTNLGNAWKEQGRLAEAIGCYRRALEIDPNSCQTLNNLGAALMSCGQLDEASASLRRALELQPNFAEVYSNLGNALKAQGRLVDAAACYRRALELKPSFAAAHSNLAYLLYFLPGQNAAAIYEEHRRYSRQHAEPLGREIQPHRNDRTPDRRLRIGYVSPDFRDHCQAFFTVPLLSKHDHEKFEIFCYADVAWPDNVTTRLQSYADAWRSIAGRSDQQVTELIRQDEIDILVDLTMHLERNRLLVFARKPAPVQVCWLAFPGTTGLATIDYRLTDPHLDPHGLFDRFYTEKSVRLPDSFWCYDPLTDQPWVNPLPAGQNGRITFGCLNNFCKVNDSVLELWSRVLLAVDGARLLLLAPEGSARVRALEFLVGKGVAAERVMFVSRRPRQQYLELYQQVDIGLDTFPANGHTTSLDAFWMGVPVVTLSGQTAIGRGGVSLLRNLGLPELIAESPEQYASIATELAGDLGRLASMRVEMRGRMQRSPLMDARRFASNVEAAYRTMWEQRCEADTALDPGGTS